MQTVHCTLHLVLLVLPMYPKTVPNVMITVIEIHIELNLLVPCTTCCGIKMLVNTLENLNETLSYITSTTVYGYYSTRLVGVCEVGIGRS